VPGKGEGFGAVLDSAYNTGMSEMQMGNPTTRKSSLLVFIFIGIFSSALLAVDPSEGQARLLERLAQLKAELRLDHNRLDDSVRNELNEFRKSWTGLDEVHERLNVIYAGREHLQRRQILDRLEKSREQLLERLDRHDEKERLLSESFRVHSGKWLDSQDEIGRDHLAMARDIKTLWNGIGAVAARDLEMILQSQRLQTPEKDLSL